LEVWGFGVDGGFQDGHRETSDGDGRQFSIRSEEGEEKRDGNTEVTEIGTQRAQR
jgi:hypothetical protein